MLNKWLFVPQLNAWVCVPAKNGGTAFYRYMFDVPDDVPSRHVLGWALRNKAPTFRSPADLYRDSSAHPRLLAVRHPVSRLGSLWRNKCRDGDPNMPFMQGWNIETLLSKIEATPFGNEHWVPQHAYAVPDMSCTDYRALGRMLGYTDQENATVELTEGERLSMAFNQRRIERLYERDFALHYRRLEYSQC